MEEKKGRPLLQVEEVSLTFGALSVLQRVSLEIYQGEILAIIGPNGAGKTSLLNVINGVYHPQQGRIRFEGKDRTKLRPHQVAALGIARTFQNVGLFKGMTVLGNLMVGRNLHMPSNFFFQGLYWGFGQKEELENRKKVEWIIDFLEIQHIRKV
ncbi:MAG: ATP-binding cassette domain-containing protein, partial [Nitrospira sp.]|nr:ATP-binding cassette domain-containing protein [Nitrospira sp.]